MRPIALLLLFAACGFGKESAQDTTEVDYYDRITTACYDTCRAMSEGAGCEVYEEIFDDCADDCTLAAGFTPEACVDQYEAAATCFQGSDAAWVCEGEEGWPSLEEAACQTEAGALAECVGQES